MSELLTFEELADWLKLSKRSCYELTNARVRARQRFPLPFIKINGNTRFVRADVEAWLQKLREEQVA